MPEDQFSSLPFLTRKMLSFEHATAFSLVVRVKADGADPLRIRGATREGLFTFRVIPDANYQLTESTFGLPDIPLWISVVDPENQYIQGKCFVSISLAVNGDIVQQLVSSYVSGNHWASWPLTMNEYGRPTPAQIITYNSSNPDAGAQHSFGPPGNTLWLLKALRFSLVTDATVANRVVHIVFSTGGFSTIDCISATAQAASLTRSYSCYPGISGGAAADDNDIIIPIPAGLILGGGDKIKTTITGGVAGDDWGAAQAFVEQYIDF